MGAAKGWRREACRNEDANEARGQPRSSQTWVDLQFESVPFHDLCARTIPTKPFEPVSISPELPPSRPLLIPADPSFLSRFQATSLQWAKLNNSLHFGWLNCFGGSEAWSYSKPRLNWNSTFNFWELRIEYLDSDYSPGF